MTYAGTFIRIKSANVYGKLIKMTLPIIGSTTRTISMTLVYEAGGGLSSYRAIPRRRQEKVGTIHAI